MAFGIFTFEFSVSSANFGMLSNPVYANIVKNAPYVTPSNDSFPFIFDSVQ